MRIVFAGTPDFAATHLAAVLQSGAHEVVAVYTQPDRPSGRGKKLAASPVKQLAEQHGIAVYQPDNFRDEHDRAALAALKPDVMLVVAYGLLLPQTVLDIPRLGCINVHASLLPRWRGAAPIQRAIEAGDSETGICIMQMEAGLDTGPVLARAVCPIVAEDTGGSLHDRLAVLGAKTLVRALDDLAAGTLTPETQNNALATYASKLNKEEAHLDFSHAAIELDCQIRAFNPFPVSWCALPNGERLRVWAAGVEQSDKKIPAGTVFALDASGLRVACGAGVLLLTELQLPNRNRMTVRELVNGHLLHLQAGDQLA